jgi:retron-type reverse transcriptase
MPTKNKTYSLDQSPLYRLRQKRRLARLLHIDLVELKEFGKLADQLYSEFDIEKKDGSLRGVENPRRSLKLVQARLARLLMRIAPPKYLFCPVKGRSYVTNAAQHAGHRVVRCPDVRKYFPSTPSRRIFWFFHSIMQCEPDIAAILARVSTYRGHLPTGSPSSPIMAYFAYIDVWESIASICLREGLTLTVYIDDVTISGSKITPAILWKIKRAIHGSGLRYHKEKHFVDQAAEVTGVIIRGNEITPPNRQLKKQENLKRALRRPQRAVDERRTTNKLLGIKGQISQITIANAQLAQGIPSQR